jgi:hypothetical protein
MAEYYRKMTEHISKITECYIRMAYSKYKMTEYRNDDGLGVVARRIGGLVNAGLASVHGHTGLWGACGHGVEGARTVGGARG